MTIDKLKNTGTQAAISFFKEYYMHEFVIENIIEEDDV